VKAVDINQNENTGDIIVASVSASQLFSSSSITTANGDVISGQLNLPEYQRPYRWLTNDVKALLADLSAYFKDCDNAKTGSTSNTHDGTVHASTTDKPLLYMGSVVLHQQFDVNAKSNVLNIIDGQQRITTLQLICKAIEAKEVGTTFDLPDMEYASPVSHERIAKNYQWLLQQLEEQEYSDNLSKLDLHHINFTLVVTHSEDEAYRFFETQNTGGVRLTGPQVIKAHHLRAIPSELQSDLAKKWESFNHLDDVVGRLLKARRWQAFNFKNVPSHRAPEGIKKVIVTEFAKQSGKSAADLAFSRGAQNKSISGTISQQLIEGYLAKQPLNAGTNTVNYFDYFSLLYQRILVDQSSPYLAEFYTFYNKVVKKSNNSAFLTEFYDITILLYVSEFGTEHMLEAAYWLSRCVFSIRLHNKKTVREDSISAFVERQPIFDWISTAYQHQQLINQLRAYQYEISPDNIGIVDSENDNTNTVKHKFIKGLAGYFKIDIVNRKGTQLAEDFDRQLQRSISIKLANLKEHNKEVLV
jgi:hypothetical protein